MFAGAGDILLRTPDCYLAEVLERGEEIQCQLNTQEADVIILCTGASHSDGFMTLRKHIHEIYSDHGSKNENFLIKKLINFLIFAQNIDCGYTLEPPH